MRFVVPVPCVPFDSCPSSLDPLQHREIHGNKKQHSEMDLPRAPQPNADRSFAHDQPRDVGEHSGSRNRLFESSETEERREQLLKDTQSTHPTPKLYHEELPKTNHPILERKELKEHSRTVQARHRIGVAIRIASNDEEFK